MGGGHGIQNYFVWLWNKVSYYAGKQKWQLLETTVIQEGQSEKFLIFYLIRNFVHDAETVCMGHHLENWEGYWENNVKMN
jgi:hypothetical protein